ncbi:MAG: aldo/keto reductase [Patulibacter minatonensis]
MSLSLPPISLGGNVFGWTADAVQSHEVLDAARDGGLHAIDTADVYSAWANGGHGGQSESIIGDWLAGRPGARDETIVATKVGKEPGLTGIRPATLRTALEASLGRLRTDTIDLYYAHDDDGGDLTESLAQFDAFVREGKIRAIGLSNFSAGRLEEAFAIAEREGFARPAVLQPEYSLASRDFERDLQPAAERVGIAVAPYFALASGFLTGKYRPGVEVDSARAGGQQGLLADPAALDLLDRLDAVAATHAVPVASVALAWLGAQPTVVSPIASARTVDQVAPLVAALELRLSADEVAELTAASDRIGRPA